jgi:hypothetical protein
VITDWRYPNEFTILEQAFPGYKITPVHIIREGQTKSPVDDISEHQLDNRTDDYRLINQMNNSIYQEVCKLIESIHL